MVRFLIIGFPQNICDDDYYIFCLLCGNYTSLHCSTVADPEGGTVRYSINYHASCLEPYLFYLACDRERFNSTCNLSRDIKPNYEYIPK